ncbi:MAG: SapC family protein [Gammaproteobacteria bacterium]|nr:SapC family protein [Gammaproteobacteria bacterium]
MTEENQKNPLAAMAGQKFLYQQPEVLTLEDHGSLGITPNERPFDFVKDERAIPLTMVEISSAQRHYPIVFSNMEDPVPMAVLGLPGGGNVFIDEQGQWDPLCYVPSYLRCYPFALASQGNGSRALVLDRAGPTVTEEARFPFFVDSQPSAEVKAIMQFVGEYEEERKRTAEFSRLLVKHKVLDKMQANYNVEGSNEQQVLAHYVGINLQKLNALDPEVVLELHSNGWLAPMYLMHYSMQCWRPLRLRADARNA